LRSNGSRTNQHFLIENSRDTTEIIF